MTEIKTRINGFDVEVQLSYDKPGQWVYGSDLGNKGMYLGMKRSGIVVVAWLGNATQQDNYRGYIKALSNYARAA